MSSRRAGFTTRASCLLAAGGTALLCGLLLGIVDLARAGVLALAVPLLSSLVVLRSRVQIANRRSVEPARANAGDTVVMHLTISNRSVLPTGPLMLEDQLPSQLRGNARFAVDGLLSRESRTVSYRMPRLARGRYRAGPLHIRLTDPFHLVDVRRSFTATNEILVAPVVETLRNVEAPRSLDVGDDAGSHSIGARGADDASTREYRTGDDLRKIHWRSSARTGALMVRQEERPWQGHLTVLLDMRRVAHATSPAGRDDGDERLTSSLEWAISAAATMASHAIVTGRQVTMISDPAAPARLPMHETNAVAEHLATIRPSVAANFDALDGLLAPVARESTIVAILGDTDPRTLHVLAGVHPRGSSTAALALLLDTSTWALGPGNVPAAESTSSSDRVRNSARVLRAAGWNTSIVSCGTGVAESLQHLLTAGRGAAGFPAVAR